jgi:hypothetical protein
VCSKEPRTLLEGDLAGNFMAAVSGRSPFARGGGLLFASPRNNDGHIVVCGGIGLIGWSLALRTGAS